MKKKKILAVLLTASVAASALGACGSGGNSGDGSEPPAQGGGSAPASESQKGGSGTTAGAGDSAQTGNAEGYANLPKSDVVDGAVDQQTYPVSEEKITLTMWYPMASSMGELADFNDGEFWQWYEENYVSWLNSHEDFGKAAYTDTGKMYAMWGVWDTMEDDAYADQGIAIRKDFLDKVGLDVPTTYDEWETVLKAFKDQLGVQAPFYTSQYGIDNGEFMAGFDTAPYFYHRDGVVQYGPMDDQYKEYLEMLHRWWEEGRHRMVRGRGRPPHRRL